MNVDKYVNKTIKNLSEYIPGEQADISEYLKLNTNESPYAIPQKIVEEASISIYDNLNRYPEPNSESLCQVIADKFELKEDNIIVGNGSSDLLSIIYRIFIEKGDVVAMPSPGFSLNNNLAAIQNATLKEVPWGDGYNLPSAGLLNNNPKMIIVTNPNNPTGTYVPLSEIESLIKDFQGIIILDEAYVDFIGISGVDLIKKYKNLIVLRSFSKSYSSAGLRLGIAFADKKIIQYMKKIQNIYSVGKFTQSLGMSIVKHQELYDHFIKLIVSSRDDGIVKFNSLGFSCTDSKANFIFMKPPCNDEINWKEELKMKKILVRNFYYDNFGEMLRISVGKPQDMSRLFLAVEDILTK